MAMYVFDMLHVLFFLYMFFILNISKICVTHTEGARQQHILPFLKQNKTKLKTCEGRRPLTWEAGRGAGPEFVLPGTPAPVLSG